MVFHCAVSCCFIAVSLVFHCCFIAVSCCFIAVSLLFHAVSLLFHCCFIAVSLLFHGVSLLCFMVFQGVSLPCFILFHDHETGEVGTSLKTASKKWHRQTIFFPFRRNAGDHLLQCRGHTPAQTRQHIELRSPASAPASPVPHRDSHRRPHIFVGTARWPFAIPMPATRSLFYYLFIMRLAHLVINVS